MPNFVERDPAIVAAEVKTTYEQSLGKVLLPAQPEQLLVNGAAYREALVRLQIQYAAEQNLVNYAEGDRLEQLGALVGVERLAPAKSRVTVSFSRTNAANGLLIPDGFRVAAPGDQIWYATVRNLEIPAGQLSAAVECEAIDTGTAFNDFAIGSINQAVDKILGITVTVANTTVPLGGAAVEDDEGLRRRIKLAPSQFSVAGPSGAYEFHALSVDPSIIDVAALNEGPVQVGIYLLTETGLPSPEILTAVQTALNDEKIRPLTDIVRVYAPFRVGYRIEAQVTLLENADANLLDDELPQQAEKYAQQLRRSLGKDIVRSQIIAALSCEGVYLVELIKPAENIVLTEKEWADAEGIAITIVGDARG